MFYLTLVYAFSQILVQILLAMHYATLALAESGSSMHVIVLAAYPYLTTMLSFGSSTCLMITR